MIKLPHERRSPGCRRLEGNRLGSHNTFISAPHGWVSYASENMSRGTPRPGLATGRTSVSVLSLFVFLLGVFARGQGFYLPGSFPQEFVRNATVSVKVSSLTSVQTELPFGYYSLPFCTPAGGVRKMAENLGELLMGERVESSPYVFRVMVQERRRVLCGITLDEQGARDLVNKIEDGYRVHMRLDGMPITDNPLRLRSSGDDGGGGGDGNGGDWDLGDDRGGVEMGYPLGFTSNGTTYLNNHLVFNVLVHRRNLTVEQQEAYEAFKGGHPDFHTGGSPANRADEAKVNEGSVTDNLESYGWMIVGFEVLPCSVGDGWVDANRDSPLGASSACMEAELQTIVPGANVTFSFDVRWQETDIPWVRRWDAYLAMGGGDQSNEIHWFAILNSLFVTCFLAGLVFVIMLRTIRNDLSDERLISLASKLDSAQLPSDPGWKLVRNDVFRPPGCPKLLCCIVGNGVQIFQMALASIAVAAFGFLSPESRGGLLTAMVVVYMLLGFAAGYTAVDLLCQMPPWSNHGKHWFGTSVRVACGFPALAAVVLAVINAGLATARSSGVMPFSLFFSLFFLWFLISVPLSVLGGYSAYLASDTREDQQDRSGYGQVADEEETTTSSSICCGEGRKCAGGGHMQSNRIPRHIPESKLPGTWIVLTAGLFPFGTAFVEIYFIMSSLWLHETYYVFGFLFAVFLLTSLIIAEISIVITYLFLCHEDYHWWWRSVFAGGSTALYLLIYSALYVATGLLEISSGVGLLVYGGYMLIIVAGLWLMCGSVSFLAAFYFCRTIYSALKSD